MAHLLPVVSSLDMSALAPVGCPSDLSLGRAWDVSMKHPPPHPAHRSGELAMPLLFFPSFPQSYVWGNILGAVTRKLFCACRMGFRYFGFNTADI